MSEHTYSFGYWLRRRRKALDLTQKALAEAVHCSEDAIRKIEADERRPSRPLAERIADRLAIPTGERTAFLQAARAAKAVAELSIEDTPLQAPSTSTIPSLEPAPSTLSRPASAPTPDAFVGRQGELSDLRSVFDEVLAGQGRIAMLAGEPGIGKTRTSQELVAFATQQGALALWGRCYEGAGAPPYWPWVQIIRAYAQDRSTDQLRGTMNSAAATIAEIVPELKVRLPNLSPPPPLDPEQARFRLFDAIATFLRTAGRAQPLVLVLDDLLGRMNLRCDCWSSPLGRLPACACC
jgi:transcriptional regulator with XRE-family HTH domain